MALTIIPKVFSNFPAGEFPYSEGISHYHFGIFYGDWMQQRIYYDKLCINNIDLLVSTAPTNNPKDN